MCKRNCSGRRKVDRYRSALLLALAVISPSCSTGQVGQLPHINSPNIAAIAKLQLAVGTATVAEPGGASEVGLNVVSTFRFPDGTSATLQNTPQLIAPMNMISNPNQSDPHTVSGLLPTMLAAFAKKAPADIPDSVFEFGVSVGVYGDGLAGDNTIDPNTYLKFYSNIGCGDIGGHFSSADSLLNSPRSNELQLPVFSNTCSGTKRGTFTGTPVQTDYYGGPPAWPSGSGYGQPTFFKGYPLGFTESSSRPSAGTYQLLVTFTTAIDYSTWATMSATANLPASAIASPLPPFITPTVHVQNDGSAIIDVTVPVGVTQAIVNINAVDCLIVPSRPNNHYSLLTRITGRQTLFLSNNLGPPDQNGVPTHTFCTLADTARAQALLPPGSTAPTAGSYTVSAVGFDYPAFEASYPQSTSQTPLITNGAGTADVTTANPVTNPYSFGTGAR